MTATQTTSAGPSWMSRYKKYGATTGYHPKDPLDCIMIVAGMSGDGKSHFWESNPDAIRIDMDRAGSSNPNSQCVTVPEIGFTGEFDWDFLKSLRDELIAASEKKQDRPRMVVLDTIDRFIALMCRQVVQEHAESGRQCETFADLQGQRAWGITYDRLMDYILDLNDHGYGIGISTHITEVTRPNEDGTADCTKWEMTLNPGLYKRLRPIVDLLAVIEKRTPKPKIEKQVQSDGKVKLVTIQPDNDEYRMLFQSASRKGYGKIPKQRVHMPTELLLPKDGGWEAFTKVYDQPIETGETE